MEDRIIELLAGFLGDYGKQSGEWFSFNCPCCAEQKGVKSDDKYNLEVNPSPEVLAFHCWVCADTDGMRGPLSKLIKRYGGQKTFAEYRGILSDYKASRMYSLGRQPNDDELASDFKGDVEIVPPVGLKPLSEDDPMAKDALDYVHARGIDRHIIERYNMGYIADDPAAKYIDRCRVYIPSYDRFDEMTYWVGRDYTGKKDKMKYRNPKADKKNVIFNEGMVNWYEPVTLVEGPFDHIAVPNSIPLLGKTLDTDYLLYSTLIANAKSYVNVLLDDDAQKNAFKVYRLLEKTPLKGRVRIIECPAGYDAALMFEKHSQKGIISLLNSARRLSDYEMMDVFKRKF